MMPERLTRAWKVCEAGVEHVLECISLREIQHVQDVLDLVPLRDDGPIVFTYMREQHLSCLAMYAFCALGSFLSSRGWFNFAYTLLTFLPAIE